MKEFFLRQIEWELVEDRGQQYYLYGGSIHQDGSRPQIIHNPKSTSVMGQRYPPTLDFEHLRQNLVAFPRSLFIIAE
jgi:hypothetical protein